MLRELLERGREKAKRRFELREELALRLHDVAAEEGRSEDEVLEELVGNAHSDQSSRRDRDEHWDGLSEREREVTALICMGNKTKESARILGISRHTVHSHLKSIYHKTGVRSMAELRLLFDGWNFEQWWMERHR